MYSNFRDQIIHLIEVHERTKATEDFTAASNAFLDYCKQIQPDAHLNMLYALTLEIHSRTYINEAVSFYEKAASCTDVAWEKDRYQAQRQLIALRARTGQNHINIDQYKKELKDHPDDVKVYACLALSLQLAEQYEDAWEVCKAGFKIDSNHTSLLSIAGEVQKSLGNYKSALAYWKAQYEADNTDISCLFDSAFLYEELGQKEAAAKTWKAIIRWLEEHGYPEDAEDARKRISALQTERS